MTVAANLGELELIARSDWGAALAADRQASTPVGRLVYGR
jgi:hypothetical protein